MAKPFRSPLLGYNHNISHLGRVFHFQTEDSGPIAPRVFTHLFFEGTILVSRKCEYDGSLPDDKVRTLMQSQHKTVMKDLMQGRLDDRIIAFFAARGEDLLPAQQAKATAKAAAAAAAAAAANAMPGAVPQAPLRETPEPVMVLPDVPRGDEARTRGAVQLPLLAVSPTANADDVAAGVPGSLPRRKTAAYQRGSSSNSPTARPAELGRPPFVRSGTPSSPVSKIASTDGVVVQRNVVIGAGGGSPERAARIRPPIPYVVTGGGHTDRLPQPVPSSLVPLSATAADAAVAAMSFPDTPVSAVEAARAASGPFGVSLADDKSLDEVILEYLSEDGD